MVKENASLHLSSEEIDSNAIELRYNQESNYLLIKSREIDEREFQLCVLDLLGDIVINVTINLCFESKIPLPSLGTGSYTAKVIFGSQNKETSFYID